MLREGLFNALLIMSALLLWVACEGESELVNTNTTSPPSANSPSACDEASSKLPSPQVDTLVDPDFAPAISWVKRLAKISEAHKNSCETLESKLENFLNKHEIELRRDLLKVAAWEVHYQAVCEANQASLACKGAHQRVWTRGPKSILPIYDWEKRQRFYLKRCEDLLEKEDEASRSKSTLDDPDFIPPLPPHHSAFLKRWNRLKTSLTDESKDTEHYKQRAKYLKLIVEEERFSGNEIYYSCREAKDRSAPPKDGIPAVTSVIIPDPVMPTPPEDTDPAVVTLPDPDPKTPPTAPVPPASAATAPPVVSPPMPAVDTNPFLEACDLYATAKHAHYLEKISLFEKSPSLSAADSSKINCYGFELNARSLSPEKEVEAEKLCSRVHQIQQIVSSLKDIDKELEAENSTDLPYLCFPTLLMAKKLDSSIGKEQSKQIFEKCYKQRAVKILKEETPKIKDDCPFKVEKILQQYKEGSLAGTDSSLDELVTAALATPSCSE